MKSKIGNVYIWVIGTSTCLIFFYTGFIKLIDFEAWMEKYNKIDFVHSLHIGWLAYVLPVLEIAISLLFLFDKYRLYFFKGSLSLFLIFTFYLLYKIYISNDGLCACGGIFEQLTLDKHLYLNIFFCINLFLVYILESKNGLSKLVHSHKTVQ